MRGQRYDGQGNVLPAGGVAGYRPPDDRDIQIAAGHILDGVHGGCVKAGVDRSVVGTGLVHEPVSGEQRGGWRAGDDSYAEVP